MQDLPQPLRHVYEGGWYSARGMDILPCRAHEPLGEPTAHQRQGGWKPAPHTSRTLHGCLPHRNAAPVPVDEHPGLLKEDLLQLPASNFGASCLRCEYDATSFII